MAYTGAGTDAHRVGAGRVDRVAKVLRFSSHMMTVPIFDNM
jgi:hypothetical protein